MAIQRIIISDSKGKKFRICKFALMKDSRNEDYIKFSFPDLKGKPGIFNDFKNNKTVETKEDNDMIEFSVHFISGVSHFKSSKQIRKFRTNSDSIFKENPLMHLMDFIIYDLGHFKEFKNKPQPLDYDKIKFNKTGKILEFYISKYSDKNIIIPKNQDYINIKLVKLHVFDNSDKKYRFLIFERNCIEEHLKTGATIHQKDNPGVLYQKITLLKNPTTQIIKHAQWKNYSSQ